MDAKSEQAVICVSSKTTQEKNDSDSTSLYSVSSDINREEKEAEVRIPETVMSFSATSSSNYSQATNCLDISTIEAKSLQKVFNDLVKHVLIVNKADAKSDRIKKEKEGKNIHPDKNNHENHHISHGKVSPISASKPHMLIQQLHDSEQYLSAIHLLNSDLASPCAYSTFDSPSVKRPRIEHSSEEDVDHQGSHGASSVSSGPMGMATASSLLPSWNISNSHTSHKHLSDVQAHAPSKPAHTTSQSSKSPFSSSDFHYDASVIRCYPIIWHGVFARSIFQVSVRLHFVSGDINVGKLSLPSTNASGELGFLKISHKMNISPSELDNIYMKMLLKDEHCVLIAWPTGKDLMDLREQADNLKSRFVSYFLDKNIAGVASRDVTGTQNKCVIYTFSNCNFIESMLSVIAPNLLSSIKECAYLCIIIITY